MKHSELIRLAKKLVKLGQKLQHNAPNDRLAERCHYGVLEFHCVLRNLQIIKEDEE